MNADIYHIVTLAVSLVAAIIGVYVVPLIREKTDTEKFKKWQDMARVAVNCAEMVLDTGKSKKEWAVNFLESMINKHGTVVSADQISALIEAAVMELHISEGK